jgi:hypothetical protein
MAQINDYVDNLQRALIDAAGNPTFRRFIEPDDIESVAVDRGDGTQGQEQALAGRSARKVIEKILAQAQAAGVDMKSWICSPNEFNLCAKLKGTSVGNAMRQLDAFLKNKWAQAGAAAGGLVAAFGAFASAAALGSFLAVLAAVGFVNNAFVDLCDCQPGV